MAMSISSIGTPKWVESPALALAIVNPSTRLACLSRCGSAIDFAEVLARFLIEIGLAFLSGLNGNWERSDMFNKSQISSLGL